MSKTHARPSQGGRPATASRLAGLMGATQRGEWYDALCPSHDDHNPSFSFKESSGGLFVLCRAGCTPDAVATALREQFPDLHLMFARQHGIRRKVIASYRYEDEAGHLLYEVLRYDPKGFTQRRPDGKGGWIPNLKGVRRVLYRLHELAAKRPKLVWVVEGEKDVDRLWALGLPATTNSGGAGHWTAGHTEQLVSQGITSVILVPDLDEAGERHARTVAAACARARLTVAIIRLPDLPEKGDVSDWLARGHTTEELRELIDEAELPGLEPTPGNTSAMQPSESSAPSGKAWSDRLVGAAEELGIELFHTPLGEPFIAIPKDEHRETWSLDGHYSRSWLAALSWNHFHKAVGADVLSAALEVLKAKAIHEGPEELVHLRTAWHENSLYYDLADAPWRVVKISPGQWEILTTSPVRFRRYSTMATQAEPRAGGSLNDLWTFINVHDRHERQLVEAWLVSALIPGIPRPILLLYGDQGGGKTTTARWLSNLIDPSPAPLVRARDEAEFVQALAHRYVTTVDNLSYLPDWFSNLLSRAVTGEGFAKRRLFTDDEDIIYVFRRVIILTGINLVVTKPDLLDRSLLINTERLGDKERIPDRVLTERFVAAQPALFGALLDLLAQAMIAYPNVTIQLPRMADFAQWGAAVAVGQGHSTARFEEAYQSNVTRQNEQALSESSVASLLLTFLEGRVAWRGTAEDLLGYLQSTATSTGTIRKDLPGTPQQLGRRLREIRPNLLSVGIDIAFSGHHHPRTITITRREAVK